MGRITAWMTGERITADSAVHSDVEERGWVDLSWSRRVFFDSRNDVEPLFSCDENDPELIEYVREALSTLGAYEDNGDGTFYGVDSESCYKTGDEFTYAVHFVRKSGAEGNYAEENWDPADLDF